MTGRTQARKERRSGVAAGHPQPESLEVQGVPPGTTTQLQHVTRADHAPANLSR